MDIKTSHDCFFPLKISKSGYGIANILIIICVRHLMITIIKMSQYFSIQLPNASCEKVFIFHLTMNVNIMLKYNK